MEADTLHEMGLIYGDLGDYQKALDSYSQAGIIYKALGDSRSQSGTITNIGWVYSNLGEYQKAIDHYEEVLRASRARGDRDEPLLLNNIAAEYASLGKYKNALEIHLQVLTIRRALHDNRGEGITLNNIANCYEHQGDRQKALDYYSQALGKMLDIGDPYYPATTLNHIGTLYRDWGQYEKAVEYLNQALQLRRTIGDLKGEAATLYDLARVERSRGNLIEARRRIDAALANVESLRANVASPVMRASFFASVRQYHEFNIDLLVGLHKQQPGHGFDALALQACERARARSLLELLTEMGTEIRQGADAALVQRELNLRQAISDAANRQTELLRSKHSEEQATVAAREIRTLTTEYEEVQGRIRESSPRYSGLTQPLPLTMPQIQQQVLDDETLLLEYSLGDERSFLWAATPTSIRTFELPRRSEIEAAAQRLFDLLTARNQAVQGETTEQRRRRLEQADSECPAAAAVLSQILLGPVASELGTKRLLIVGEGVLQYIPFAALPEIVPEGNGDEARGQRSASQPAQSSDKSPLIVKHELISLPSASVLAVLRREAGGRKPADKTIAVLADPVFDRSDPRVAPQGQGRQASRMTTGPINDVRRSEGEFGLRDFVRLRFSRQEAELVTQFADEGKKLKALDFAASRELATSPELGQYGTLHFATHGVINNQHPELSGIVLSLVDEQGRPQNGYLRLYDIYNLKLQADLVVLSACQTAVGKDIKGEGLVGLTRGFMYAGAPRVVASLWQVEDRATADLMGRLYEAMLRQGLRPAAALRAAQLSAWRDTRWRSPYYWAAFTLQGEWR